MKIGFAICLTFCNKTICFILEYRAVFKTIEVTAVNLINTYYIDCFYYSIRTEIVCAFILGGRLVDNNIVYRSGPPKRKGCASPVHTDTLHKRGI